MREISMIHTTYYASLVRWEVVDEIVFLAEPIDHAEVRELILKTLDHAVMEEVLRSLHENDHEIFLNMCEVEYHSPSLLEWLEAKADGIRDRLRDTIQRTKAEIREVLSHTRD